MLELKNISKSYTTADFTQVALDDVSVSFRDNEFVAILGPSGSGKTTLLNIIGGLDHYDSGDLLVDGVSTKEYKDRDWDAYRNNRIGFVFQSYNLIPHQTILENVELALTLSGVDRAERRERAKEALEKVGLGEHINKKPSQLSGGQMQRVAIARALINDPEILLADEPTGALDSKTSVQIMDLLTEIADDRLVIMVTHNPDLADQYANRIVRLTDGVITSDSNPFDPNAPGEVLREAKPVRRTHMSFFTALSLSFRNLMTKKGRTFMTAFAGSIGIIGIAAILALANGVNSYIADVEEETLSEYPLSITSQGFDMTSLMTASEGDGEEADDGEEEETEERRNPREVAQEILNSDEEEGEDDGTINEVKIVSSMFSSVGNNDLASLKEYLDSGESGIEEYVNSIEYTYDVTPQIFSADTSDGVRQVNPDSSFSAVGLGSSMYTSELMSSYTSTDIFSELPSDPDLYEDQYDVVAGRWPESYDEVVLVLTEGGSISDFCMYAMGLRDYDELEDMVRQFSEGEEVEATDDFKEFTYEEVMDCTFKLVNACDFYEYDEDYDVWKDKTDDEDYMLDLVENGVDVHVVGVVEPNEDATVTSLSVGLYYTPDMVEYLVEQAAESDIVQDQIANPDTNVFSGKSFIEEEEEAEDESSFDMESMFTIDGEKIEAAFTIDEDALTEGMSDMDLDMSDMSIDASSLDMDTSSLSFDMDSLDMSDIDMSDVDMSDVDLSDLDLSFDLSGLDISFEGAEPTIDTATLADGMGSVMSGFFSWYSANMTSYSTVDEAVDAYMASDEVSEELSSAIADSIDMSGMQEEMAEEVSSQVQTQVAETISEQVVPQLATVLSEQIASAMSEQISAALSEQIEEQLTSAVGSYMEEALGTAMSQMTSAIEEQVSAAMEESMSTLSENMASAMSVDEDAFAEAFEMDMDEEELTELIMSLMTDEETSYENNLSELGYADWDSPSQIDIYPIDFESKEGITDILDGYNQDMEDAGDEDKVVSYTDVVGSLMSSVTTIVNMISYVLTAFVAISLVVSSIMIGIITYISVLERKKEIGILRSIGASKGDIANVFNAETIIVGLCAGIIGIAITLLASLIVNPIMYNIYGVPHVMLLPWKAALVLVLLSVALTFLAGLIPSHSASKKDPVEALRSE